MTRNTHPDAHPDDPHYITRSNWLRAAVLGANDGIVSVGSLIVGVATAAGDPQAVMVAGGAGLAAGALSMAAGEYVSVSSQADIEAADIHRERQALRHQPDIELEELILIYESRGLAPDTARLVACELTEHDALGAHIRDELGLVQELSANPMQAAMASGATFTVAGGVPYLAALLTPRLVRVDWRCASVCTKARSPSARSRWASAAASDALSWATCTRAAATAASACCRASL